MHPGYCVSGHSISSFLLSSLPYFFFFLSKSPYILKIHLLLRYTLKSIHFSDFLHFYLMSLFFTRTIPFLPCVIMSPLILLVYDCFSNFPCFSWWDWHYRVLRRPQVKKMARNIVLIISYHRCTDKRIFHFW